MVKTGIVKYGKDGYLYFLDKKQKTALTKKIFFIFFSFPNFNACLKFIS